MIDDCRSDTVIYFLQRIERAEDVRQEQTFLGYRTDFSEIKEKSLAINNSHSHSKQLGRPSIQCIYNTMRLIPIIQSTQNSFDRNGDLT